MAVGELRVAYQADPAVVTDAAKAWLATLSTTAESDRPVSAAHLRDAAAASTDRAQLHLYGLGLARLGAHDDALVAFEKACGLEPADRVDRVNVAVAQLHLGHLGLARQQLARAVDGSSAVAAVARQYQAEIDRAESELGEEWQWAELRAGLLRERVRAGAATVAEEAELGRVLATLVAAGRPGYEWPEAIAVLERVRTHEPGRVDAMESLVLCYASSGRTGDMHAVLRELEVVASDSPVLRAIDGHARDNTYRQTMRQRSADLLERAQRGGAEATAAITELRALVQRFPANEDYRTDLMFAEAAVSGLAEAARQAHVLAELPGPTHERHFNIAQIFYLAGDRDRGETHFARACELASTSGDRRDVEERLAYLRSRPRER